MRIKEKLQHIIKDSLKQLNVDKKLSEIIITLPKDKNNGDYSTNIALTLTKELHKKPEEIAELLKRTINDEMIDKIEVAYPGFINIFISKKFLLNKISEIIELNINYGKNDIGKNRKINIEFVSANPTGELHIGHGRGATYGDNLARILKYNGFDVTKEYYINDAGNQMNNLGISIKERYKELCGLQCNIPTDGYYGKEIIEIAKNIYNIYGNAKLENDIEFFKKEGLNILLDKIKKDLDKYRVNFDIFTSEQSLYDKGLVDSVLDKLNRKGHTYLNEDALWLKTTNYIDEKDRVLIKSDGTYTYLLPDIAYHVDKFNRNYDGIIDIFGADHHGYINRLKSSLEMLDKNSEKLEIKILQMVRLIKDGEELKLSKRTGKTVTLNELIDELGVNATRYYFSSRSIDSSMDFDIDLALKQSSENPFYYIEYANARIYSILKNYNKKITKANNYSTIDNPIAYTILAKLCEFEDIVISAGLKQHPHLICNYLYELATLFHSYYASEKIVTEDEIYTNERLNLLLAIKIVINNALDLIGIIPREEM